VGRFDTVFPATVNAGEYISATATDLTASQTSEFSTSFVAGSLPSAAIVGTSAGLTVDGNADAAWAQANAYSIDYVSTGVISGPADLTATYKTLWDNTYLYVLVDVTDDAKVNDSGANPW